MSAKDGLLSIGEISKLTGAGVQALRYYERKKILTPAYIDPDTGYRYYSLDQIYYISFIINCVQFGIPLKELAEAYSANNMVHMKDFLEKCIKDAERKINILSSGVNGMNKALQRMELGNLYNPRQIYTREFPEKYLHVRKITQPLEGASMIKLLSEAVHELYGENFSRITDDDNLDDLLALPDLGCLCKYSKSGASYYVFGEIPEAYANKNTIKIPAGKYYFRHDKNSQLENAPDIFREQIDGKDDYIIVETQESFLSKSNITQPMYELRLIA